MNGKNLSILYLMAAVFVAFALGFLCAGTVGYDYADGGTVDATNTASALAAPLDAAEAQPDGAPADCEFWSVAKGWGVSNTVVKCTSDEHICFVSPYGLSCLAVGDE